MIRGRRVTLRPFQRADLPALRRWFDDGAVMPYWGERRPLVADVQFERDLEPDGRFTTFDASGYFCICDEHARPIGYLEYTGLAGRDRRAQLGILLGERDALDQGYGSEAIVVLLNWLFNQQNAQRVWLGVEADNPRTMRVYERIGFTREDTLRRHNFYDGAWHDQHFYGILRDELNAPYRPETTGWVVDGVPQPAGVGDACILDCRRVGPDVADQRPLGR
jgi:RimJ/RimL family protein N-acetyltransferase